MNPPEDPNQAQLLTAYREVIGTIEGRFVFASLLTSAGLFKSVPPSCGTEGLWFYEGRRSIALMIHATCLMADPDGYKRLLNDFMGD